ncbi:TPA: hypothetical protein ACYKUE_006103 [Pseudomonas aeruginosa]
MEISMFLSRQHTHTDAELEQQFAQALQRDELLAKVKAQEARLAQQRAKEAQEQANLAASRRVLTNPNAGLLDKIEAAGRAAQEEALIRWRQTGNQ